MDYKKIIKSRKMRYRIIRLLSFIPDKPYVKMVFRIKVGQKLNLKNPVGYNEKQNWLKLYDKHPEYTQLVDKLKVRDHIAKTIGEQYLIPLLGAWKSYDDIDFDSLPNEFVLKCNHDSGSVRIVRDKSKIDHKEFRKFYNYRLKYNPFCLAREYPYKDVKPMIIAEKLMKQEGESDIRDYKFLCFDGEPKYVLVVTDRSTECNMDYYNMDFKQVGICDLNHKPSYAHMDKPENFEEMRNLARVLAKDMKFVRMDFYDINGKVYFGEYTIFDGGAFDPLNPEWEKKLGDLITLE